MEGPLDYHNQLLHKGNMVEIKNEGRWSGSRGISGKIIDFKSGISKDMYVSIETKKHGPLNQKAKN